MQNPIPVFVINLERSTERRQHMEQQLLKLSIPFSVTKATDGKNITSTELNKIFDKTNSFKILGYNLTANEVACADSHLRIYEFIVNNNIPYALILEDDVTISPYILRVLTEDFLSKEKFDWLQIDYARVGLPFLKTWMRASALRIRRNPLFSIYALIKIIPIILLSLYELLREKLISKPSIVSFARPLYLASAYIITKEGAQKLLTIGRPIKYAADMLPNKARILTNFNMKAITPPLGYQDKKFDSEIGAR